MIDIGVNLLHGQFAEDSEQVLVRARSAGVEALLITATDLATSRAAVDFAQRHGLYCTAGVHPHDAKSAAEGFVDELRGLAGNEVVRAIGETGLDFNRNYSPADVQRRVFRAQLELAAELGKPLFVHDRDSEGEVYEMLQTLADASNGVVVHCFTGSRTDLVRYLDAGFFIGITGWICDEKRGAALSQLVPEIPLDRLLLETDAPFLLPHGIADWPPAGVSRRHRRRNEPMLLPLIAERVAALYGLESRSVIDATTENARRLFQLPQPG